jgi:hypothetical protein
VALAYTYYNFSWIPRTIRVTPAMAIGVTTHPWDLDELLDALLSVPETAPPTAQPLAPRKPDTTARELPNGRGFLRVVQGGGTPAAPPPAPPVTPAPAVAAGGSREAPAGPSAPVQTTPDPSGQLDLLAWRPPPIPEARKLPAGQLDLFGIDFESKD